MSVTINSPTQDSLYPDYQIPLRCVTPGLKPFSISYYKKKIIAKKKKKKQEHNNDLFLPSKLNFIKRTKLTVLKCAQLYYQV